GIIQKATDVVWAGQPKTVLDGESFQPFGFTNDAHLQSIDPVLLDSPDEVFTTVHGYVDAHIFGVNTPLDFTLTTMDTISIGGSALTCKTSTFTQVEDPGPDTDCPSPKDPGKKCHGASAGCPFVDALPKSVPLKGGTKRLLNYVRANVSSAG